ncbi:MAG: hypothetical protein DHS80DRAFT_25740 [Piptocephalis tieghemiana]|nr:MAG: hypothetical protein DHS80DRAFT_25740 [Piptocephalis tieghemiana]
MYPSSHPPRSSTLLALLVLALALPPLALSADSMSRFSGFFFSKQAKEEPQRVSYPIRRVTAEDPPSKPYSYDDFTKLEAHPFFSHLRSKQEHASSLTQCNMESREASTSHTKSLDERYQRLKASQFRKGKAPGEQTMYTEDILQDLMDALDNYGNPYNDKLEEKARLEVVAVFKDFLQHLGLPPMKQICTKENLLFKQDKQLPVVPLWDRKTKMDVPMPTRYIYQRLCACHLGTMKSLHITERFRLTAETYRIVSVMYMSVTKGSYRKDHDFLLISRIPYYNIPNSGYTGKRGFFQDLGIERLPHMFEEVTFHIFFDLGKYLPQIFRFQNDFRSSTDGSIGIGWKGMENPLTLPQTYAKGERGILKDPHRPPLSKGASMHGTREDETLKLLKSPNTWKKRVYNQLIKVNKVILQVIRAFGPSLALEIRKIFTDRLHWVTMHIPEVLDLLEEVTADPANLPSKSPAHTFDSLTRKGRDKSLNLSPRAFRVKGLHGLHTSESVINLIQPFLIQPWIIMINALSFVMTSCPDPLEDKTKMPIVQEALCHLTKDSQYCHVMLTQMVASWLISIVSTHYPRSLEEERASLEGWGR